MIKCIYLSILCVCAGVCVCILTYEKKLDWAMCSMHKKKEWKKNNLLVSAVILPLSHFPRLSHQFVYICFSSKCEWNKK